jgi:hypothetical protein
MRYVNGVLCAALTLFAIVQYNDPDALLWFLIYAIPAAWTGIMAFRPRLLSGSRPAVAAFLVCLVVAIAGCIYMWPTLAPGWIDIEEEREGIGLMIVAVSLLVAGLTWWRQQHHGSAEPLASR